MGGSLRLGKIAGISIEINYSWLIVLVLLTTSLGLGWFPQRVPNLPLAAYLAIGLLASVLLFASVLLHELSHSIVARARGLSVKSITLFIFGGVSNLEEEPRSAGAEFQIAVIGPVVSLVIGAVSWLFGQALADISRLASEVCFYLAFANVLLGIFNLIPGFPLDGGRVLRSVVWAVSGSLRTATRWASASGQIVAYLFILWGIWQFFSGNVIGGLWIGFIGWFLLSAAQSANAQVMVDTVFRGVTVRNIMQPPAVTVPATITLQHLVDSYVLPLGLRTMPVTHMDQFVGLITLSDIRRVPRDEWLQVPVSTAMVPLERMHVARPDQNVSEVLPLMARQDVNQLPVIEDGRLVGVLSRDAIVRFLDVRRGLGIEQAEPGDTQRTPGDAEMLPQDWRRHGYGG